MRKIFFIVLVLMLASGWWLYSESKALDKHPAIQACEYAIVSMLKAPSTYKFIEASMIVSKGTQKPLIVIDYDAKNMMGVPIRSKAICYFGIDKESPNYQYNIKKQLDEKKEAKPFFESPFDELSIVRIVIDDIEIPKSIIDEANSNLIILYRLKYKGPKGIGKIVKYIDYDTFECADNASAVYTGGSLMERIKNKYFD